MENARIGSEFYIGCMVGAAIGNSMGACCRSGKMVPGFTSALHFDGLMQLALFTAEGLLRATHRAKLHGTNGTFAELIYESYQRWLKTQMTDYNDLVSLPKNDGWLIRRSEMYYKGIPLEQTPVVLKKEIVGELGRPFNEYSNYEALLRVFPVGLMFPGDAKLSFQIGSEVAALTHGVSAAYLSAGFYAALISALAGGQILTEALETALGLLDTYPGANTVRTPITDVLYFMDELQDTPQADIPAAITRFIEQIQEPESAANVLAFGLFCVLRNPANYKDSVLQGVRYKAAPHAVGMLAGSLSGLMLGETALPDEWFENLKHRDIVMQVAEDLITGIKGGIFVVDRDWLAKYPGW